MTDHLVYENPLVGRYASRRMSQLWGAQRRVSTWRSLWVALAEAQCELGLAAEDGVTPRIRVEHVQELRSHVHDIDFARAADWEHKLRHDVMAHIHAYGEVCPGAKDILHLGATSCFVTDNTDLILMREGLGYIRQGILAVIKSLARFARQHRAVATLGFTHFQPAQLTTVGKRACLWCHDFLLDLREVDHRMAGLALRGVKGTTGTQASFLSLFRGDHDKVRELDRRVARKMGFEQVYAVTGQTYTRKVDTQILDALSGIGQSASKLGTDLRLLAHRQELEEPHESEQVGSSAMAYKKNPMRSERMCSIGRFLTSIPVMAAQTASTQWLERTLDDSAIRRLYLPQSFLAADAILRLALNICDLMQVNEEIIRRGVQESLPFMATEALLMAAVSRGGDRQVLHERIRVHSNAATEQIKHGANNDLLDRLREDSAFSEVDFGTVLAESSFVGRAPEQVDDFLRDEVGSLLDEPACVQNDSEITV